MTPPQPQTEKLQLGIDVFPLPIKSFLVQGDDYRASTVDYYSKFEFENNLVFIKYYLQTCL